MIVVDGEVFLTPISSRQLREMSDIASLVDKTSPNLGVVCQLSYYLEMIINYFWWKSVEQLRGTQGELSSKSQVQQVRVQRYN